MRLSGRIPAGDYLERNYPESSLGQIVWTNGDDIPHTVVSDDKSFKSKVLDTPVLRNASAVSDAPHSQRAGRLGKLCGARPIQLFEGSRRWGGTYAN
jgi:hypothetical protein